MSWLEATRTRVRLLFARGAAESRMEEEIRFHLEMEASRLVREEGVSPQEARRRARVAFGGVDRTREELRSGRGLAWLSGLRLDLKLGGRMLVKYPLLTVASVLALAIAIALAASWFQFMTGMVGFRIPLPDAARLVAVQNRDLTTASSEPRSLHDFELWRAEVESLEDLSAASSAEYTVTTDDGRFTMLRGARVTSSLFRLTRVQPLLGRPLTEADFDAGAAPAVVLGHAAWQRLFDGERSALGSTLQLGSEYATVVGVMPPGYAFPLNHELWTPLRESGLSTERRAGPQLGMFARLARGTTLKEAQAELAVIGRRMAADFPDTHAQLRPAVDRFARTNDMAAASAVLNIPFLLFLVVVSINVATLLFARTVTRESEIALRSALGASRRRIIAQLVAEALVLTSLATLLGLIVAHWGLGWGMDLFWEVQQMRPPFWFRSGLSAPTVAYAVVLALLGALIIGGVPGLRATRRQLRHRLPQPGTSGAGMGFGAMATTVIVVQVALCVAFIPVAIMNGRDLLPAREDTTFPADAFLSARLTLQPEVATPAASPVPDGELADPSAARLFDDVQRRLAAQPGVIAATRASRLPGFNHPIQAVEIEGDTAAVVYARQVAVDANFFDVMGARIVAGRPFHDGDVAAAGDVATSDVAIVDEEWARANFGGRNVIGQRIRYARAGEAEGEARWYEIVGVVAGTKRVLGPAENVVLFHPLRPATLATVQIYLRTAAPPATLAPAVHATIMSLHRSLAVANMQPLDEVWRPVQRANAFFAAALAVVAAVILFFVLIGIYALMSFTVAQRTREIGIRAALGAEPRRIITAIFSRALWQIGLGVVAGATLVSLTAARSPDGIRLVGGVAVAMVAVGLMGCALPALRALRIQPTRALRAE